MDGMEMMHMGTPWLDKPIALHDEGGRVYTCKLNDTALCDWQSGYWRFWYEADWHYALPTVGFFLATIAVFGAGHLFNLLASRSIRQSKPVRSSTALLRFVSYRAFRIPALNWTTAPLGILALGAVGTIYFFCMILAPKPYYWPTTETLHFGNSPPIATRAGWLSLACLPFIFATAGKSNFITAITGVSHEKLQVFHRWISYACFITALIHTFPFIIYNISQGSMVENWNTSVFYWTGVVALIAQAYLTFASLSPLRSMGYEWFKFSHFVAALVFMLFMFFHCDHTLSSWDYFIATGVLFAFSWLHRQVRIYFEHGIGHRANISLVANGFICVRIPTTSTWGVGQHFFVRFLSLGIHTFGIHPFTACSLPAENSSYDTVTSELVLYIRPQKGFTARLAKHAETRPNSTIRVLLDGPYGGIHGQQISSSARQLVVAGGSGAGWLLPMITTFLRDEHRDMSTKTAEPSRSAKIVLATRDVATHEWFEETVLELLATFGLEKVPSNLEIELYYTGDGEDQPETKSTSVTRSTDEINEKTIGTQKQPVARANSDSSSDLKRTNSLRRFNGRPDLKSMVHAESTSPTLNGQLGVFVCGPASMQIVTSNAVAAEQLAILKGGRNDVYLHMEHFSWA